MSGESKGTDTDKSKGKDIDTEMRIAYGKWETAFKTKNITTTPAYDVVGLMVVADGPDLGHFDKESNVKDQGDGVVVTLKSEHLNASTMRYFNKFNNQRPEKEPHMGKILIITDAGEECDDEVTCLLADRMAENDWADVKFLFTNKEFDKQRGDFVRRGGRSDRVHAFPSEADACLFWLKSGEGNRTILQIGPIHEPKNKDGSPHWTWRPDLSGCEYNYVLVGLFKVGLNAKGNAVESATYLMNQAQQKLILDTKAGKGAFPFAYAPLNELFPANDIIDHVCKIGWRNSVGRADAFAAAFTAHLVSTPVGEFQGGANYETVKTIDEQLCKEGESLVINRARSSRALRLAAKYLDQLKNRTAGPPFLRWQQEGPWVNPKVNQNGNHVTEKSIVDGYAFILDALHYYFNVPIEFFKSGKPEDWKKQWDTPGGGECPTERFKIDPAFDLSSECALSAASGKPAESAFLTGIPAGHLIRGIGQYTKGLSLYVRQEHFSGSPSLSGSYKLADGHSQASQLLNEHMPVGPSLVSVMIQALATSKQYSFESLRQNILQEIGVVNNAELLNYHLFHPSQWQVASI